MPGTLEERVALLEEQTRQTQKALELTAKALDTIAKHSDNQLTLFKQLRTELEQQKH
jgi:hypothetical protein